MTVTGKAVYEETPDDWDERFSGGWQEAGGSYQSLVFMAEALRTINFAEDLYKWQELEGNRVYGPQLLIHDYGCALGDGTALLQALFQISTVIGFDHSPEGVRIANERWPNIEFRVGDIEKPEAADIIWTSHVIEHLRDSAIAVENLRKYCKLLIVVVPLITAERNGGHDDAEPTIEWLKRCPEPTEMKTFRTARLNEGGDHLLEDSILLAWRGSESQESTDPAPSRP